MTLRQTTRRLGAAATATLIVLVVATLWLVVSDPVAVAGAVADGDVAALGLAVARLLGRGLVRLVFGR